MTLETVATIMSILASIAVIVTLLFIALQIQHSMSVVRLTAAQMSAQLLTTNLGRVIEYGDFAELVAREDYSDLTPAEMLRVTNFLSASFRHFEVLHAHRRTGLYEEELWQATERRMVQTLLQPDIRNWWSENRQYYATSFAGYVDGLLADASPAPPGTRR